MLKIPNAFIAGTPKSGTTALFHYLRQHPNMFTTNPKEPNYFATDLPGTRFVQSEAGYQYLFQGAKKHHHLRLDGSILYLYSKEAIANIKNFNPQAKLVVMFRNPVDLVYSFHSELVYGLEESEEDFAKAWQLNSARKQGQRIPESNREPKLLYYDEIARHGEHLARLLNIFPRQQVHIIFFEDLQANPQACYERVLEFLDLPFHSVNLEPINENKQYRNAQLARWIQRPPAAILTPYLKVKKAIGIEHKHLGLRLPLLKKNTVQVKRKPLSDELHEEILQTYREDIQNLSKLTGRNLDHWLKVTQHQ